MPKRKEYCFVPGCTNTGINSPHKIFFSVPSYEPARSLWIKASRRDMMKSPLTPTSHIFCCEDHFDIQNDMQDYRKYLFFKEKGMSTKKIIKPGVIPHIFACQPSRSLSKRPSRDSNVVQTLEKNRIIQELLVSDQGCASSSSFNEHQDIPAIAQPVPEVAGVMKDCGVQVSLRSHFRSKAVQTCPRKRIFADSSTQVSPAKQNRISNISISSSSSSARTASVGSSLWTVSPNEGSTSTPSSSQHDFASGFNEYLQIRKKMLYQNPKLYLGVPPKFIEIVSILAECAKVPERNILISLKKLKLNLPYQALGDDFCISSSQVGKIVRQTVPKLAAELQQFIYWPAKMTVLRLLPIPFRKRYRDVISIIDCFEVEIEKPNDPRKQSLTWSEYYKCNTAKILISCTPSGLINFISPTYGGRSSDTAIAKCCGFLKFITTNDAVMADRGFKGLATVLNNMGAKLVRPPSVVAGEKLSREVALEAKRVASLRIHVERVIGRLRHFKILSPHSCIDNKLIPLMDCIAITVGGLVNIQAPIIS